MIYFSRILVFLFQQNDVLIHLNSSTFQQNPFTISPNSPFGFSFPSFSSLIHSLLFQNYLSLNSLIFSNYFYFEIFRPHVFNNPSFSLQNARELWYLFRDKWPTFWEKYHENSREIREKVMKLRLDYRVRKEQISKELAELNTEPWQQMIIFWKH